MHSSGGLHLSQPSPSRLEALARRPCRVGEKDRGDSESRNPGLQRAGGTGQRSLPKHRAPRRRDRHPGLRHPLHRPQTREGRPFPRERVIDGTAPLHPHPPARLRTRAMCFGRVARGRERVTPGAAKRRPSFPPPRGSGRSEEAGTARAGPRALGSGRWAERSAGWRPRVESRAGAAHAQPRGRAAPRGTGRAGGAAPGSGE